MNNIMFFFSVDFSDTGVPVQSNDLIHLLKSVFCIVIPSYTDAEIMQVEISNKSLTKILNTNNAHIDNGKSSNME